MSREMHGSSSFQGAADDIKRGLERIKQAQVEVMRQLKREGVQVSRNHSLSYSKQSHFDNRFNHSSRLHTQGILLNSQDKKLRQEIVTLAEEARKSKQAAQVAEAKMKQYEKGEERALAKVQEALANAISSQKKYIQIKNQYDRIYKSRQQQSAQIKRIQARDLSELLNKNQNEPRMQKIIKQLRSAHETFGQLIAFINSHKCFKKQTNPSTNLHNSVNLFTISTFDAQLKLNRHVNNVLMALGTMEKFSNIQQVSSRIQAAGFGDHTYLSCSFRDDIKKIQEELQFQSLGKEKKMSEIQDLNSALQQRNRVLQQKNRELEQEIIRFQEQSLIKRGKIKKLESDIQLLKFDQSAYSKPQSAKSKEKISRFEKYKKLAKLSEGPNEGGELKRNNSFNGVRSEISEPDPQKQNAIKIEILEDRIIQLQKYNTELASKLKQSQQKQLNLTSQIQKLREQSGKQKQIYQQQILQAKSTLIQPVSKTEQQIREMVDVIQKLQQEKERLVVHTDQLIEKYESESIRYQAQVQELEVQLMSLKNQIEDLRRESTANSCHSQSNSPAMDQHVEQLWAKKEQEYKNTGSILNQLKFSKKKSDKMEQSGSEISSQPKPEQNFTRPVQPEQETKQRVEYMNPQYIHPMSLRGSISQANMTVGNNPIINHYGPIPNQRPIQVQPYPQMIKPAPMMPYPAQYQPYPVQYPQPQYFFR